MTWLIAGLGNPGPRYANHRHNIGFRLANALAQAYGRPPWRARFLSETMDAEINGERALLLKPMTYMNDSGQAVGEALRYLKIPLENLIVIHDELDLASGKLRVKVGGGDAGHNGLKSISAHCGGDYKRVRVGIGHPLRQSASAASPGDKTAVHGHVLQDFAHEDELWLEALAKALVSNFYLLLKNNDASLMNKVQLAVQDKLPKEEV
jgi:PTH1 family peptidyl-tRNA hydrolase